MNAALSRLHGALEQDPVEEANTKLEAFFKWEKVLETYAAVWPRHFQRDQKKRLGMWETINSFFEKLSKYFPLASIDFGYGSDWEDWASSYIPFEPANWYDPECVEEWQSLTAKVLYEFGDEVESDWASLEKITGIKIDRPAEWKMGDRLRWKRISQGVCARPARHGLRALGSHLRRYGGMHGRMGSKNHPAGHCARQTHGCLSETSPTGHRSVRQGTQTAG
jgi:hypothetical protein